MNMAGERVESDIDFPCPTCQEEGVLKLLSHSSEIPYFGEHTQITLSCNSCGMRQTDFIPAEERGALAHSLLVDKEEHLLARVVRGASGTIRIPELDLEVAPGTQATGYVSNVEGVVKRFIDIIQMMMRQLAEELHDGDESGEGEQRLGMLIQLELALTALRDGSLMGDLTVEILDPKGHSIIAHADVEERELTDEEIGELEPGPKSLVFEGD